MMDKQTNTLSLSKLGQFIALVASTWVLIHQTRAGNLTEWLLLAYLATWSGANAFRQYLSVKQEEKK